MRHILARANRHVLERFARSNVLVAFDFDGTLAPVVRSPDRAARAKRAAREAILVAASSLGGARLIGGKQVVNILPPNAPHKGTALERAMAQLGCETAVYVGDDDTDEDVFRLAEPGRLLAIRVGAKAQSAAPFHLVSQREVDDLLRALLACRSRGPEHDAPSE
jgi:trehalose 6-phosphate phosphatase